MWWMSGCVIVMVVLLIASNADFESVTMSVLCRCFSWIVRYAA